ncbi:MAG TPA: hypothetical protein VF598_02330, partial [Hymenobacter sp.]
MTHTRTYSRLLSALLSAGLPCAAAYAQTPATASTTETSTEASTETGLTGQVVSADGATPGTPQAGTSVAVISLATGIRRASVTNATGYFAITGL